MAASIASITDIGFGGGGNINLAVLFGFGIGAVVTKPWMAAFHAKQRRTNNFDLDQLRVNPAVLQKIRTNAPKLGE